ncbi:MAG: type VI secretion system tip protein TssI/VgrG [Rhodocyclaceae bacterium]
MPQLLGKPALVFWRLSGQEDLCTLSEYVLELKTPDDRNALFGPAANLDTDAMRGQELTVEIELDGSGADATGCGVRQITGLVTGVAGPLQIGRHLVYRFTVRPWLWLATLRTDFKIYQHKTVVQILDELLGAYGYPVDKRLSATYPAREYQTQYGESDYEFFQRLTQEWGVAWHIEHQDDKHRLVLTDNNGAFKPFPSAAYQTIRWQAQSDRIDEEHLHTFEVHDRIVSGEWLSNDYDFDKPRADLTVRNAQPLNTAHAERQIYEWPGDHAQPATGNDPWAEGGETARVRMEAIRQHGTRAIARGNVRAMVPGRSFVLTDFLQTRANCEYIVLGAKLVLEDIAEAAGEQQRWHCEVSALAQPSTEIFRPERRQPKPRSHGPQTATVVGPSNEETWVDLYGRIRIQFHWDRLGKHDADSSCWVRVSSAWQGERYGQISIPRIGQEVIVEHLNGDPDCPIITGRVANRLNMPQWSLPDQHALAGFVSKELHGERSNTFVQDDTQGQIQTQLQSDHRTSWLSLGFITRVVRGAGRKDKRGEGFELRSDGQGVVRASGLLLSTEIRPMARAHHKDLGETVERLKKAQEQHDTFGELAQELELQESDDQAQVARVILGQNQEIKGEGPADPEAGVFPELSTPHLVLASPRGIEATSGQSIHVAADDHVALTSNGHTALAVGKRLLISVSRGVRTLVQSMGWKLFVSSGDIDLRALKDGLRLFAKLDITAHAERITIRAKEELVISGGGSSTTYNSGGITHRTNGKHIAHAASHSLTGPASQQSPFPPPPKPGKGKLELFNRYPALSAGIKAGDFKVEDALGKVVESTLDAQGFAPVADLAPGPARVSFGLDPSDTWDEGSLKVVAKWPEQPGMASVAEAVASQVKSAVSQAKQIASQTVGEIGKLVSAMGQGDMPVLKQAEAWGAVAAQGLHMAQRAASVVTAGSEGLSRAAVGMASSLLGRVPLNSAQMIGVVGAATADPVASNTPALPPLPAITPYAPIVIQSLTGFIG